MLIILMILLLSNYFLNLQANSLDSFPFTGKQIIEDTCVIMPIRLIRSANNKMIERKYLLKVVDAQDSIIQLNNEYILQQDTIINDLKNRILETNRINDELKEQYKKERTKKIIYGSIAGAFLVATVTSVISISVMRK